MTFDGTDLLLEFKALKAFALEVKQLCLTEVKLIGALANWHLCHLPPQSRVFDWVSPWERLALDNTRGMSRRSYDTQGRKNGNSKTLFPPAIENACQPKTILLTLSFETRSNELSEKT